MMNKLISLILVILMLISASMTSFADTVSAPTTTPSSATVLSGNSPTKTKAPDIPAGTFSVKPVIFKGNQVFSVYSAPNSRSIRGAKNKARVSTNDWIQVFGVEGDWIMVQYAISADHYRIGYIPKKGLPKDTQVGDLNLTNVAAIVNYDVEVTDDPLKSHAKLAVVKENTKVVFLGVMGDWSYIESESGDKPFRGFVPTACLSGTVTSMAEARLAMRGTWKLFAGNALAANRITFNEDETITGQMVTGELVQAEWTGKWSIAPYDTARSRYWNEPEFELVISHDGDVQLYGLRICRQLNGDNGYSYALVLSDGDKSSGMVLCE